MLNIDGDQISIAIDLDQGARLASVQWRDMQFVVPFRGQDLTWGWFSMSPFAGRIRDGIIKDKKDEENLNIEDVLFFWMDYLPLNSIQFSAIGQYSNVKDILIYEGSIESPPESSDVNTYEPKIKATNKLIHTFFYLEKEGKYFTKK